MRDSEIGKLLSKAERYIEEGEFRRALKIFQELEGLDEPEILLGILDGKGNCHEELKEFKPARQSYRRGYKESKRPEDKSLFWRKRVKVIGLELLQKNKLSLAAKILKGASEREPSFPEFYWHLSDIYFPQKEYEAALGALEKFLDLEPDQEKKAAAFLRKGLIFEIKNDLEEAEKAFLESTRLNPNNYRPYICLGDIWTEKGEGEKAFEVWGKAEKLGAQEPFLFRHLFNFSLSKKNWEKGREYFRKIIEINPDQIGEILEEVSFKEAYQIIFEEIFRRKEIELKEDLLKILEEEKINIEWAKALLVEKKEKQSDFIQRKIRKGKKVTPRERWILGLAEKGLSKIKEIEEIKRIEEEKAEEKETLVVSQIEPAEFEEWEATLKAARRMKKRKPKRPVRPKEEY